MSKYAEGTSVSPEKSRAEIETILKRYGADQFMYGIKTDAAAIAFHVNDRNIRFVLPMPDPKSFKTYTRKGRYGTQFRTDAQAQAAYEQDVRQRWRALCLCIKAKLEAVQAGITTFEDEFMAHIVLPGGRTVSEHARPMIREAYESGTVQPLLPHFR